nr:hypothetical protein [Candidatus Mycoplasma haematolamae]
MALLASVGFVSEVNQIDIGKVLHTNKTKNKELLTRKEELKSFKSRSFSRSELLKLPVHLVIFDDYYKKLSEWNYKDSYYFDEETLVFDKRDFKAIRESKSYQKYWMKRIDRAGTQRYGKNDDFFPFPVESLHIDWRSGIASSLRLQNILELELPEEVEENFKALPKNIFLRNTFEIPNPLPFFAGYWNKGVRTQENNFIDRIEYGVLKKSHSPWSKLLVNQSSKQEKDVRCDDLIKASLANSGLETDEGFDAQCDQVNLKAFYTTHYSNNEKIIYSSKYASLKRMMSEYSTLQYFFYSLGVWKPEYLFKLPINQDGLEKEVWTVDFDELFIPEIKEIKESDPSSKDKRFELVFYLNHQKVGDPKEFLKIASVFDYKMRFQLNGRSYETPFNLWDVLEQRKFTFTTPDEGFSAFSSFVIKVSSGNSAFKFIDSKGNREFSFKPQMYLVAQRFNLFKSLVFDHLQTRDLYFAELKERERLEKMFFASYEDSEGRSQLAKLGKELEKMLKFKLTECDESNRCVLSFFDFFQKKWKRQKLFSARSLPTLKFAYVRKDRFTDLKGLISEQTAGGIGSYFWDCLSLKLLEKDILQGREIYELVPLRDADWVSQYAGKRIEVKDESSRYVIPKGKEVKERSDYASLFSVDSSAGLKHSDFTFKKIEESPGSLEVQVEYKPKSLSSLYQVEGSRADSPKIIGKTSFKLEKKGEKLLPREGLNSSFKALYSLSLNSLGKKDSEDMFDRSLLSVFISSILLGTGLTAALGTYLLKRSKLMS